MAEGPPTAPRALNRRGRRLVAAMARLKKPATKKKATAHLRTSDGVTTSVYALNDVKIVEETRTINGVEYVTRREYP